MKSPAIVNLIAELPVCVASQNKRDVSFVDEGRKAATVIATTKGVRLIVVVKVTDETRFLTFANELTIESNNEEGCLEYSVAKVMSNSENSDCEYAFVELWASEEALAEHRAMPHCARLLPLLDGVSTVELVLKSNQDH